jgi:hypothetical protein
MYIATAFFAGCFAVATMDAIKKKMQAMKVEKGRGGAVCPHFLTCQKILLNL